MSTIIDCTSCRRKLAVGAELLGKPIRCPSCGLVFEAPAAPAPAPVKPIARVTPATPSPKVNPTPFADAPFAASELFATNDPATEDKPAIAADIPYTCTAACYL